MRLVIACFVGSYLLIGLGSYLSSGLYSATQSLAHCAIPGVCSLDQFAIQTVILLVAATLVTAPIFFAVRAGRVNLSSCESDL